MAGTMEDFKPTDISGCVMWLNAETYFDNKAVHVDCIQSHTISDEELAEFRKLWNDAVLNGKRTWTVPIIGVDFGADYEQEYPEEYVPRTNRLIEVGDE